MLMQTIIKTISLMSLAVLSVAGCTSNTEPAEPSKAPPALVISAAFYPLEYVSQAVGGDLVEVRAVVQPGVEPHDFELSPAGVRSLRESDVIVYIHEFQPSVDAAVDQIDDVVTVNVEDYVTFRDYGEHGHEDEDGHHDDDDDHGHEDDDHAHGETDPHFWLDPVLYGEFALALGEVLADLDADNAQTYRDNAAAFAADMAALDAEFSTSLAQCEFDVVIVPHEAYGYLGDAYGFEQVGLSGLNPDAEPSPARIREVREIAEQTGVSTIFFETLVDSSVSEAFARDLGLDTAVLDPIEGLLDPEDDYRSVMDRNRDALAGALGCQ